jgi:nitrite reductase/ring-hydroxylating ferredoxin subunit
MNERPGLTDLLIWTGRPSVRGGAPLAGAGVGRLPLVGIPLSRALVRFTPGEGDIAPDSGAVVRRGAAHVALYRGSDGTVLALDARCPHQGCVVVFNAQGRSWDCPCHGARFALDGSVIDGRGLVHEGLGRL